jgi:F0F1-type ATP synthase assembly protein I
MKSTVRRLVFVHLAVLVLAAVVSALIWGLAGSLASVAGVVAFSAPVVAFSFLVLRASSGDAGRFWGRFMGAEVLKWLSSAALLALAFWSGRFAPQPLLAGFLLSVIVQVFFPILVPKESQT